MKTIQNLPSESGHIIENAAGTELTQREKLQFSGYLTSTDDSTNDVTIISDAPTEIEYDDWLELTEQEKEGTHWLITNAPSTVSGDTPEAIGIGIGVCSTAAATVAKTATLTDYVLTQNGIVAVRFTNAVPANATLNINSEGAIPIYYKNAAITADVIAAGVTATFVYDGNVYQIISLDESGTDVQFDPELTSGTKIGSITIDGTSTDMYAPTPEAQVNADWEASSGAAEILHKPTLGTASALDVAASGDASTTEVVKGDDSRLTDARNAADVYDWAKASTKPTYTAAEVGLDNVGNFKAVSTVAYQGLTSTEQANARSNMGLGTGAVANYATSGDASSTELVLGNDSRLSDSRPASDVSAWAKASTKPTYTASEVGAIATSAAGSANGVASLDSTGKVPSSQLPSYVDDIIDGYYYNGAFYEDSAHTIPITGEAGKIYVDVETNKTYRWSGTAFVEISGSLALGETSSTAYRGDYGKAAHDHSLIVSGNPHNVTAAEVGLGNVGNFKAVSTVANQGLTDTEKENARNNIGAGSSSFDGDYNNLTNKPTLGTASAMNVAASGDAANGEVVKGDDSRLTDSRNAADVYSWAKAETKPTYTASEVGLGNVGNFKAVSTEASQGLTDTEKSNARANIGAGTSSLELGSTSSTAAAGDHTHTASIAASAETADVTLAANTAYELTAGGDSYVFKTPADTFRSVEVNGTEVFSVSDTDPLNLVSGDNITITNNNNGEIVITGANTGHTIEDADETALTQRDTLRFSGYLKTEDDSTDEVTVISDEPTVIAWAEWNELTAAEKEGTKWLITNVPSAITDEVIFVLRNRNLTFNNLTATISDGRINAYTYPLVYWSNASYEEAEACKITSNTTNGSITFTAEEAPESTLVCDIVFVSDATGSSGGGGGYTFEPVSTEANQGLSTEQQLNARNNIALGTASLKDVATSGDASTTQVVMGDDSRLTDSRNAADVYSWAKAETKPTYTASEVGAVATTEVGAANGIASLDSNGKIPSSQLPGSVDEIIEGYLYNGAFYEDAEHTTPITGETSKIYVDLATNKTYRYSGSAYVEISASLALGETEATAYRGDRGKTAYDHSQVTTGNPHNVTKSDVGLGNVGNFKAVSTEASQGLTSTEQSNARANIGAGTSNFDGAYSSLSGTPTLGTASALDVATTGDASTSQVVKGDDTRLTNARNAADVYDWAKASTKPTYTASEVGLGNVGNFKAVSTVANQGLTSEEQAAARANIGAGSSSFDGNYNNLTNKPTLGTASALDVATSGNASTTEVVKGDDTRLTDARNAADVYSWAKAETKPTYTASEVGLGNVGNFKAVSTEASQGLTDTEKSNARANIGAGTSNFDGAYSSLSGTPTLGTAAALDVASTGDASTTEVVKGDDSRLTDARNAADVYSWAKAETKPTYSASEVGLGNVGNFKAVSTVANQGLTSEEQAAARSNIGLGNSGNYKAVSTEANQGLTSTEQSNARTNIGLGTAAVKDVPVSGNASTTQVVMGDDTRLSDARNAADVYEWAKASTKPTYTASEVGAVATTEVGAASGVASLDSTGKIPSSQLPSYVDDIIEGYLYNGTFYEDSAHTTPITGETGKIYVDLTTNKTYRYSGSGYVEISESLALGETSSTAYRGDYGKAAYDHSLVTTGNPHNVTASDVGLGNVGNFKAVSTVANQGLTDTEKSNARANIGAGNSSFSGSYNDLTDKPTLGTASALDIATTGDASVSQVVKGDDSRLTDARNAADVYSWAKAETKPTYSASEVGLGNVGNFKAVSTEASQGLTDTEKSNARANIGAGTSSFDGAYSSLSGTPTLGTAAALDVASTGDASTTEVVKGDDSRLTDSRNAADVYEWAKASTKPTYSASEVGLGNVGNFKAVSTEASQGLTDTEKSNARANIGAGTAAVKDVPTSGNASTTQVVMGDDTRLTDSRNAADVYSWAKAETKPTYTASEVGLGNVGNFKAVSTVANQGLTSEEQAAARANIGAGSSSFSGSYNDLTDKPTLGSAAALDVATTGDASTTEVVKGDDTRLTNARNAADVYSWAKAETKPTYTASEVGAVATTVVGAVNGVASLDSNGKVPSSQLPSYVDDIIEGYYKTADGKFYEESTYTTEIPGETGKIYVDLTTNKTYRYSGSAFVEISESLALGETSSTAYRGDYGKAAYDHSLVTTGNPHNVTASDVGLGNVGNFKAVSTVANQGLTSTEQANARANIGAGTSSFDGAYSSLTGTPTLGTAAALDVATTGDASTTEVVKGDDSRLTDSRNAADVYSWAKAETKPTYTASEVGLGNVGNFKAVSTVANQGLTDTEKSNARANIGAGTSSFDGAYSSLSGTPTLGTAAALDVASTGDASTTEVVKGDDSRLTDSRNAADVYSWAKASTKPTYTASEVGLGNVGNFKAVSTEASQGLTSTEQSNARANIGAGTSSLELGSTSSTAAAGDHTHTTSMAVSAETAEISLAANSTYSLTAGGTSYVFKTPADTDTHRSIKVNGTEVLADNTSTALDLVAGNNVTITNNNGVVTIASTGGGGGSSVKHILTVPTTGYTDQTVTIWGESKAVKVITLTQDKDGNALTGFVADMIADYPINLSGTMTDFKKVYGIEIGNSSLTLYLTALPSASFNILVKEA